MFPYRDENETLRTPVVTWGLVAANVLVWLLVQGAGTSPYLPASVCNFGLIPGELTLRAAVGQGFDMGEGLVCLIDPGRAPQHVLTSMFLHGGWMHLLGNLWFLWLFGNNVEDSMGRLRYLGFYLLCGLGAALGQVLSDPASPIPMVGASGAISGVMGAYILLYPQVRIHTLVVLGFLVTTIALPAWLMLGYWFALQLLGHAFGGGGGGVAYMAHVGGFVVGAALIRLFARPALVGGRRKRPRPAGWTKRRGGW